MEASALNPAAPARLLGGRSPLLRLQSDERLVALSRRGNHGAFEVLVARYHTRLLSFCRHMLGSREDAEDVLQEVFAAAFGALLADERDVNLRPWLYRIARNRCLNHLRRTTTVGVDSMDVHLSEHGLSTADKVHRREEFRQLLADVRELPETQRTALLLRELDALSYEQIAEAMETTVPGVKSLLVRARVSLAEAAQARRLSCDEARLELGEVSEGLRRSPSPPVRRHLRTCGGCADFRRDLRHTNRALAAVLPVGPVILLRKLLVFHLGHGAGAGSGAVKVAGGAAAAGAAVSTSTSGGLLSAGLGAAATKAAAAAAAAGIVAVGAAAVNQGHHPARHATPPASVQVAAAPAAVPAPSALPIHVGARPGRDARGAPVRHAPRRHPRARPAAPASSPPASPAPPARPVTETVSDTTTLPSPLPASPPEIAPAAPLTVPVGPPQSTAAGDAPALAPLSGATRDDSPAPPPTAPAPAVTAPQPVAGVVDAPDGPAAADPAPAPAEGPGPPAPVVAEPAPAVVPAPAEPAAPAPTG